MGQSISSMINTILKVVDKCGDDFDAGCGRAATRLVKAMAGLTSASGGIKQKCHPGWLQPAAGGAYVGGAIPGSAWMHGASALCVLDVKNTAKNLLKSIKNLVKVDKKCKHKHSRKCTKNSLKIVGALAGLGEYIAAAIGDCQAPSEMSHDAECAQESIMLVHHVTKVAEAGVEIGKECKTDDDIDGGNGGINGGNGINGGGGGADGGAGGGVINGRGGHGFKGRASDNTIVYQETYSLPRRYEEDGDVDESATASFTNLALGASLPLAAVVSFAAGKLYAGRRTQEVRDFMSDNE